MAFEVVNLDGNGIEFGEAQEDGSFDYTDSNTDNGSVAKIKLIGRGTSNANNMYFALLAYLRGKFGCTSEGTPLLMGLPLHEINMQRQVNPYFYTIICTYQFQTEEEKENNINKEEYDMPEIEDNEYSFNANLESTHITQAYRTLATYPLMGMRSWQNFKGLINPDSETKEPKGCEVMTAAVSVDITVSLPCWWFTREYRNALCSCVGCINKYEWDGWGAHNVLFNGVTARPAKLSYKTVSGNEVKEWYWRAAFSFQVRPTITKEWALDIPVNGQNTVQMIKPGWDLISVYSNNTTDTSGKVIHTPIQADLLQVYPEIDFDSVLSLPVKGSKCRRAIPEGYHNNQARLIVR